MPRRVLIVLLLGLMATPLSGQYGAKNGEWRSYAADPGSTKYSPLDQINKDNAKNLRIAWRFKTDNFGARPDYNMQVTPLMVNGVMYAQAGMRRAVVAIDPTTGELLWMWRMDEGKRGEIAPRQGSGRGVAYWTDGKGDERILTITPGYHLVALNAKTGIPVASFGRNGIVDLKTELDQPTIDLDYRRHRHQRTAGRRQQRRRHRRGAHARQRAAHERERQRLRPRVRRPHGQAPLDLPHHSAAGRVRERDLGERLVVLHRQRRQLGRHHDRRRAQPRLSRDRDGNRRLLRRTPARREPVYRQHRQPRPQHRQAATGTSRRFITTSGTGTSRAPGS